MDNALKEYTALSSWLSIYPKILPRIPTLTISWRKAKPDSLPSDYWRKQAWVSLILYPSTAQLFTPNLSIHPQYGQLFLITYPLILSYEALQTSKLKTLECRRDELCRRFINSTRKKAFKNNPVYNIIIPSWFFNEHDYFLRRSNSSGTVRTFKYH
jgi:hypothetical protein